MIESETPKCSFVNFVITKTIIKNTMNVPNTDSNKRVPKGTKKISLISFDFLGIR